MMREPRARCQGAGALRSGLGGVRGVDGVGAEPSGVGPAAVGRLLGPWGGAHGLTGSGHRRSQAPGRRDPYGPATRTAAELMEASIHVAGKTPR